MATTQAGPVRKLITDTRPGKALAHRFVAGDDVGAAIEIARSLGESKIAVSLDLLGEDVSKEEEIEQAVQGYVECLQAIEASGVEGNISVKLTQLGLEVDPGLAANTLDLLAIDAAALGLTVTIDMESSEHTDATVSIYEAAQGRHGNLGICLQAYLHRTPEDLRRLMPLGGLIRLCKGAYVEPAEVALQGREEVDRAFARLLDELMHSEECHPAIATHDPALIAQAKSLAGARQASFEFQMLFGVRPEEQRALAGEGYAVRVYVPYGSNWYAYLTRRLAERPANLGLFARALVGKR
jgi:proline dehydrogenase